MYLNVKINDVPVQLEIKTVGPASLEDIDKLKQKIEVDNIVFVDQNTLSENLNEQDLGLNPYFDGECKRNSVQVEKEDRESSDISNSTEQCKSEQCQSEHRSGSISTDTANANGAEKSNEIDSTIETKSNSEQILNTVEDIKDIFEKNKDPEVTQGMKPWWKSKTIISNVFAAIGCIFGVMVSEDLETSIYLPATVVAFINLYLRSITKGEIKLPMEDRIKNKIKKIQKK